MSSDDYDGLSTDICSSPDIDLACQSSPSPVADPYPDEFGLDDNYLVLFQADDFSNPSHAQGSEASEIALELDHQSCQQGEEDQVLKSTRLSDIEGRQQGERQVRPKLGARFNEFLGKNTGQKRENFLTSLGRDFIKKIGFCVCAEVSGFDKAYKELLKLHSRDTKNVKVPAKTETLGRYLQLFHLYTSIPEKGMLRSYGRSIKTLKAEKHFKTWSVEFQRYFYAPETIRVFFYHYMQFLDGFGEKGEGKMLVQELKLKPEESEVSKCEVTFGYMTAIGLQAFDGVTFARVFSITRF